MGGNGIGSRGLIPDSPVPARRRRSGGSGGIVICSLANTALQRKFPVILGKFYVIPSGVRNLNSFRRGFPVEPELYNGPAF